MRLIPTTLMALLMAIMTQITPAYAEEFKLVVDLEAIKSDQGNIFVELYRDPSTFRKSAKAVKVMKVPALQGALKVEFESLQAGTYALLAYHDEDDNGVMNKRLGMIPLEGYALSNNPEVFGPPKFEASSFALSQDTEISMRFKY
jgi:uncharacterized protein (DUF2141 family)